MSIPTIVVLLLLAVIIIWLLVHRIIAKRKAIMTILPQGDFNPSNNTFHVDCIINSQQRITAMGLVMDLYCQAIWESEKGTSDQVVFSQRKEIKINQMLLPNTKSQYSFDFQGPFLVKQPSLATLNAQHPRLSAFIEKVENHPLMNQYMLFTKKDAIVEYRWLIKVWLDCKGVDCVKVLEVYTEKVG
jgi:hypothetical protein